MKIKNKIIVFFLIGIWAGGIYQYNVNQGIINQKILKDKEKTEFLKKRYLQEDCIIKKGEDKYLNVVSSERHFLYSIITEGHVYYLLMVNKYNKTKWAARIPDNLLAHCNKELLKLSLDYLNYGANQNDELCVYELERMYSNGDCVERDTVRADSLNKVYHRLTSTEDR